MTTAPSGRLIRHPGSADLILTRHFRAEVGDVWASVTEPERTARWFGPWQGEAAQGRTIKVQMAYDEGTPWVDMRVEACRAPQRLVLATGESDGNWLIELLLADTDGRTELSLIHHGVPIDGVHEFGPGWEFYLDMLVASREGGDPPSYDDYYESMKGYYDGLVRDPA
ncbi:SRPBCC family protein [Actinoplanes sp. NPDC051861]|uniref:SRPBCC family protein n=1 Tax=Actinoplanes sp. NPDC051861 TaxID=3155170 RepID=UPI00341F0D4B